MLGFPHIRKAHCMYGWDWGPRLPDAGIFREISLIGINAGRITNMHIRQNHTDSGVFVCTDIEHTGTGESSAAITITAPDGKSYCCTAGESICIESPQLWWPNGLGAQPLYTVHAELLHEGNVVDALEKRIGLRTMTIVREKDEWGESFAHCVNGVQFFAMGAGDAFWGAMLWRMAVGKLTLDNPNKNDLSAALSFANAAGAISATKSGGIPSMPKADEMDTLMKLDK